MHLRLGGIGIAVAVLAAACGEPSDRLPAVSTAPLAPDFAVKGGGGFSTKCSFQTASQLAGSYFTDNDTAKVVRSLISSMKSAGEGTVTARDLGFDVLDHVSTNVALNPDVVTGSALVNELIKCMFSTAAEWPASYTAATPGPEDFTIALDAQQNGAFGVRGGDSDETGAVLARLDQYSGVAPPQDSSWSSILANNPPPNRVLLYGRPSTAQVGINPNTFYNWRIVARNTTFTPAALVGLCINPDFNAYGDDKAMVRRQDNTSISYLPYASAWFLIPGSGCTEHTASLSSPMGHLAASFLKLGSSLFSPRPLHATNAFIAGGLAGSTGGIHTDYGPDFVDSVFLSFTVQPHDANVCSAPVGSGCSGNETISPVTVQATWKGYVVGGVRITVVPVDNNGTPAEMRGDTTLVTGEDGTVTYTNLGLTKPGGYRLLTVAELVEQRSTAIVIPHVTSDRFNIRP
jgi:hypothetical protein